MLLKQHLDMIGRNEPIQRKAKFWQSYVRALKDNPSYLDPEESHFQRMSAIRALLPMKDRFPQFYHPKNDSPSIPQHTPSFRAPYHEQSTIPTARHVDKPAYRKPMYSSYTGTSAYQREFDSDETHVQRMSAIRALLPMKYRFPQFYHPKNDSPEVPPPSRRGYITSTERLVSHPPDKPAFKKPLYSSYTGTTPYRRNLDSDETHTKRMSAIRALLPMKYRFPKFYHPDNAAPSVPHPSFKTKSHVRSTVPAVHHDEKPAYRKPMYSSYTGNLMSDYSSAVSSANDFQRAFSSAVTSYSSDFENSRVVTKKTTSYIPILTSRIDSDIIPSYLGRTYSTSPAYRSYYKYYLI